MEFLLIYGNDLISFQHTKKNDKSCINNYRLVSLLPICGKIFEPNLYNPLFLYLESNNLLTSHQSGFPPNDSCIYQLLSTVHSIYADFDHNPSLEVRGNFLDIFWIFLGYFFGYLLLYKLESIGISGNLLKSAEATCVEIVSEMKKCFRLKDMLNFNIL